MNFLPAILMAVLAQVDAPPSLSAEPAQVFSGHSAAVYAVDSSPDGSLVATASLDGTVKLWRVADGAERIVFSGHKGKVMSVAFSPDGRSLVSGGEDKTVKLWDVPLDQGLPLAEQLSPVRAVVLHEKSGRLVTAGADGSLRIWNLAGRKEERVLEPAAPGLRTLAVDRSGTLVAAAGSDRTVRIWDLAPPARAKKGLSLEGTPLVRPGEKWRLWRGKTSPPAGWNARTFDASAWELLPSGFGYGTNPAELKTVTTRLDDMKQDRQQAGTPGYLSIFVRAKFNIADPSRARKLILKVAFDDGFVAFLNGMEVVREGLGGNPPGFRQGASATVADAVEKRFDLTPHLSKLKAGENLLALQGHNVSTASSDFVLSPSLFAVLPNPPAEQDKPGPLKLAGSQGEIRGVDFSLDGSRLAAAGDDRMVRIWRLSDGQEVVRLQGGAAGRDLVFIDNNTLAVAGA
ncbi:MAG: WD40 repeat domain-containing protein, partial [Planctomycetes bacterium]|nr:WD40 repeat domain-containing protein [Planctomycetota bacterium]